MARETRRGTGKNEMMLDLQLPYVAQMCKAWFPKGSVTPLKNSATSSFDFPSSPSITCSRRCGWSRRQASTTNSRGVAPYVVSTSYPAQGIDRLRVTHIVGHGCLNL